MARPENRSEARALSLTLPIETFNYLVLLATLGKLGRTENEVATHILVREVYAMYARNFHEERIPAADIERVRAGSGVPRWMPHEANDLWRRNQSPAGRHYPTVAPKNNKIDPPYSRHCVSARHPPDAIGSLQDRRAINNFTKHPTWNGCRSSVRHRTEFWLSLRSEG